MSVQLQPILISTALPDKRNKLPSYQTYFCTMPPNWLNGTARIGRVCIAISAKADPTTGVTHTIGGPEQNPMMGVAAASSGVSVAPPVGGSAYTDYDLDAEGRELIVWAGRVGTPYRWINGGSGRRGMEHWFNPSQADHMRPMFRDSAHSGMSYSPSQPGNGVLSLCPGWSNFTGTPETGSDTAFNVTYIYFDFERLSATSFRMRATWAALGDSTANMNYAAGQTLAQIAATCDTFANGTVVPNGVNFTGNTYTITTAIDPSLIFAEYPFACLQNPFPHPIYLMHTSRYAGV